MTTKEIRRTPSFFNSVTATLGASQASPASIRMLEPSGNSNRWQSACAWAGVTFSMIHLVQLWPASESITVRTDRLTATRKRRRIFELAEIDGNAGGKGSFA